MSLKAPFPLRRNLAYYISHGVAHGVAHCCLLALPLGLWVWSQPALAQSAQGVPNSNNPQGTEASKADPRLNLRVDGNLIGGAPIPKDLSTYLSADRLTTNSQEETVLEGGVILRRNELTITSDKLNYSPLTDRANATGNVTIRQPDMTLRGPEGSIKVGNGAGRLNKPTFELHRTKGKGNASEMTFDGVDTLTLQNPNYTVCPVPNPDRTQEADWYITAEQLELDRSADVGRAENAKVVFQGVPILATPYLSFPTSERRKSGFLAPSFGSSSNSGFEFTVPYYWNIAPNRDLTLYPKIITGRGVQLGSNARYLGEYNQGEIKYDYLPSDRKTETDRFALAFQHAFNKDAFSAGLNINKVSDDQYFVDFSRTQAVASQRILLREGFANYQGTGWRVNSRVVRHQTLQLLNDPILKPYDRLPEVNAYYDSQKVGPVYFSMNGQFTEFSNSNMVEGSRALARARVELPFVRDAYSVISALSVQSTAYNLSNVQVGQDTKPGVSIPTFSMDGSIYFDRKTTFANRSVNQTLEPRLFYLYTPFKEQSAQPNFDTTLRADNFSRIFSENRYAGYDRVGDANQLTAGVTSRYIDDKTGEELLRLDFGQRYFVTKPKIMIEGEIPVDNDSDFFASVRGRLTRDITLDYEGQYDADTGRNERGNVGVSYSPSLGKRLNAGYRYTRDNIDQFDVSGQWPLTRNWSGVGRLNYSLLESRPIETLAGLEYNDGCWAVRMVGQRFATSPSQTTTSLFIQLELTGLGSLGSNPLDLLSRKVPGYTPFTSSPYTQ
ncbi:MAG: LPS-assembly protein LptD [Limnobacter sp.]|nr:LPS-assembly protein LptD [Limnobacter sp.]